jgi:hypothetical protein
VAEPLIVREDFTGPSGALSGNWIQENASAPIERDGLGRGTITVVDFVSGAAAYRSETFAADQYAQIVFRTGGAGAYSGAAVRRNGTGAAARGYAVVIDGLAGSPNNTTVVRADAGVSISILEIDQAWSSGDVLRLEIVGTTLTVKRNGVSIGSVVDATYSTGAIGVRGVNAGVAPIFDAFEGGDLVTATAIPTGLKNTHLRQFSRKYPRPWDLQGWLAPAANIEAWAWSWQATQASGGPITATLSKTLGALTSSATATLAIVADFNKTLGAVTTASTTSLAIRADLAQTLGAVTLASTVGVGIKADLAKTLGLLTVSATAGVGIGASLTQTLGQATLSAATTNAIAAALSQTLGTLTTSSGTALAIRADLSQTLGALTLSSQAGAQQIIADCNVTFGTLTVASSATLGIAASLTKTFGTATLSSAVSNAIAASLSVTLGALTGTQSATEAIKADLAVTLGALTATGTAKNATAATLTQTLGAIQISAAATLAIKASLAQTLGALTLSADVNTGAPITATLNATLGALTLSSAATGLQVTAPEQPASGVGGGAIRPVQLRMPRSPTYYSPRPPVARNADANIVLGEATLSATATMGEAPIVTKRRFAIAVALSMH